MEGMEGNADEVVAGKQNKLYPTYDEWLAEHELPPETIPTPLGPSTVDIDYKRYLAQSKQDKQKHPSHPQYSEGERYVYGTTNMIDPQTGKEYPRYGPADWDQWFSYFYELGQHSFDPFQDIPKFREILGQFGYKLGKAIVKGGAGKKFYDNQIWTVSKLMKRGFEEEWIEYACKIVSVRNYVKLGLPEAGRQILKEATLLRNTNHESILKVFKNIFY